MNLSIPKIFLLNSVHKNENINFLNQLTNSNEKKILLNFSVIENSSKGDLMVLLAQLEKGTTQLNNQFFRTGAFPSTKKMRLLLNSSSPILHQSKRIDPDDSAVSLNDKSKTLDPLIIDSIVKRLTKIGIKEYFHPFNTFLTEIIGNAVEHGIENKNINWWLSEDINNKTRTINYTFVDMGNGIVNSHKDAKLPLKYYFKEDKHIVLDALTGKLGSSTGKSNRGKGLPQLCEMIKNEIVSDLLIITNKVSICYTDNEFIPSKIPNFVGTYFSWSINKDNYHKWKSTL